MGLGTALEEVFLGSVGYPEPKYLVTTINAENELSVVASHAKTWATSRRGLLLDATTAPVSVDRSGNALQGRTRTPHGLLMNLNPVQSEKTALALFR